MRTVVVFHPTLDAADIFRLLRRKPREGGGEGGGRINVSSSSAFFSRVTPKDERRATFLPHFVLDYEGGGVEPR